MEHGQDSGKIMIYQLSLRVFTPEGTIKAASKMLPFLAKLNITHIQLSPVVMADDDADRTFWSDRQIASGFDNPKNSYRLKDYFAIDPEYGNDDDLREFVELAHRLNLRIIMDLVYLHCGPKAVFLKDHPGFVRRKSDGDIENGPWHFPLLNYDNPELREYLWSNMLYFVENFNIDGYRCDVGDMVPLDFWEEGIRRIRSVKPDLFMLNEGKDPSYLKIFDANYFYDGCFDAVKIAGGDLPASHFKEKWSICRSSMPPGGKMLHFIDNHDVASDSYENRHEKVIGSDGIEALFVLTVTLDGVPFMFNGYEVMDGLKHNMFANRFYGRDPVINWANGLTTKGTERIQFIQNLNRIRLESAALCSGGLRWLSHDAPDHVLVYLREGGGKKVIIIINMHKKPVTVNITEKIEAPGLLSPLLSKGIAYTANTGGIFADLLGYGYLVAVL
jgi:1,4-alpha-glucan branching enzyme